MLLSELVIWTANSRFVRVECPCSKRVVAVRGLWEQKRIEPLGCGGFDTGWGVDSEAEWEADGEVERASETEEQDLVPPSIYNIDM